MRHKGKANMRELFTMIAAVRDGSKEQCSARCDEEVNEAIKQMKKK